MNTKTMSGPLIPGRRSEPIDAPTIIALAFLALLIVAAIVLAQTSAPVQVGSQPLSAERFLAQNPELSVARRYAIPAGTVREEWFLARNPELMATGRYAEASAALSAERFQARNPELMVNARYTVNTATLNEAAFLAQNPELSVAARYKELRAAR